MTLNLFSSFNPTTQWSSTSTWLPMLTIISLSALKFWMNPGRPIKSYLTYLINMFNQLKPMLNKSQFHNLLLLISLMTMILQMNILSLFPHIYPWTSSVALNMSISLPFWTATIIPKLKNPLNLAAHMIPPNTPYLLMPLMAMIEAVSLIIQPLTLSIRLTANITAGHIIITLVSQLYNNWLAFPISIPSHLTLSILEMCVALIQAYVFAMLLSMYLKT